MQIIIAFFVFCIVLFIYLHIQFHLKTSNDLEVFEIDQASKDRLEEVVDYRQPVIFDFDNERILKTTNKDYILSNYKAFEVKIRNAKDTDYTSEIYMPLPMHATVKLFDEDKNSSYFSEHNEDFLQETGIIKNLQYNDEFIRPYMLSNCNYDVMMGSENTCTPLKYELNYRNYFLVTQGSIQIKLAPPSSTKYLYMENDYENFEFRSPVNPWSIQPQYSADFDKIKCLDITLTVGKIIHIPAYWWYSIQFGKNTSISCFRYRTYMNNLAISPYIALYALQLQNVKRNITKKYDSSSISNPINNDEENSNKENSNKEDSSKEENGNNEENGEKNKGINEDNERQSSSL